MIKRNNSVVMNKRITDMENKVAEMEKIVTELKTIMGKKPKAKPKAKKD